MKSHAWILVPGLLTLTACSSREGATAAQPTVTVTATATATATETVTGSPDPPPAPEEPASVGETVEFEDVSVTLHDIDLDPAPEPGPQPSRESDKWVSTDVELCSHTLDGYFSTSEWSLVDTKNRQFGTSNTGYSTRALGWKWSQSRSIGDAVQVSRSVWIRHRRSGSAPDLID